MPIVEGATAAEIKIGSISSDVLRKTAIRVPAVITPPEYRLAAAADSPHCGIRPSPAPITWPNLPTRERSCTDCSSVLRSSHSMARYVMKRNGTIDAVSFIVSIKESRKISAMLSFQLDLPGRYSAELSGVALACRRPLFERRQKSLMIYKVQYRRDRYGEQHSDYAEHASEHDNSNQYEKSGYTE